MNLQQNYAKLSTSPNKCHYTTLWRTTCVSLFITDNCCTNTRHTQLISSSLLMKNCLQLHHQSICRMTELRTDYDQEARRCCWPPAPQTTHIQQEHYGQHCRTTRQHTVHVRPLSRCETKLQILSNQTCCLPTVLAPIPWNKDIGKVFIRSHEKRWWAEAASDWSVARKSNTASLISSWSVAKTSQRVSQSQNKHFE